MMRSAKQMSHLLFQMQPLLWKTKVALQRVFNVILWIVIL